MHHCRTASSLIRSALESATRLMNKAPNASPRMKADSMISNECVALPLTIESMRVQAISYRKLETAVAKLTARRLCLSDRKLDRSETAPTASLLRASELPSVGLPAEGR